MVYTEVFLQIKDYLTLGMITMTNLISDALKKELKALINEVLDEREYERKLEGPYDMISELEGVNIEPAMLDDAYAHHFNFVGIDTSVEILS